MEEKSQMYFWMMLSDIVTTLILETMANAGVSEGEVTKEMWLDISAANVARRKAAAEKIKSHGKE